MNDGIGGFSPIFVFTAYTVVWLVLFAYVFSIARRQREVREAIIDLQRELALRKERQEPPSSP